MHGSQAKLAAARGVARERDFTGRTAESVANLIRRHLDTSTKTFMAIEVLVAPPLERPAQVPGCVIPGIQLVRHLTRTATGTIIARPTACFNCMVADGRLCTSCATPPTSLAQGEAPPWGPGCHR